MEGFVILGTAALADQEAETRAQIRPTCQESLSCGESVCGGSIFAFFRQPAGRVMMDACMKMKTKPCCRHLYSKGYREVNWRLSTIAVAPSPARAAAISFHEEELYERAS